MGNREQDLEYNLDQAVFQVSELEGQIEEKEERIKELESEIEKAKDIIFDRIDDARTALSYLEDLAEKLKRI